MTQIQEIEQAIAKLPREEFFELVRHLRERHAQEWDRQIEEDASRGKLRKLYEQLQAEAKAEHTYHVAKEKCDMQKGKDEKACEKQVKAEYDKAKADIKKQFAERKDERPRSASSGVTK